VTSAGWCGRAGTIDEAIESVNSFREEDRKFASSEESVGEFWLWKLAEHVIQREFGDPEGPVAG